MTEEEGGAPRHIDHLDGQPFYVWAELSVIAAERRRPQPSRGLQKMTPRSGGRIDIVYR